MRTYDGQRPHEGLRRIWPSEGGPKVAVQYMEHSDRVRPMAHNDSLPYKNKTSWQGLFNF